MSNTYIRYSYIYLLSNKCSIIGIYKYICVYVFAQMFFNLYINMWAKFTQNN